MQIRCFFNPRANEKEILNTKISSLAFCPKMAHFPHGETIRIRVKFAVAGADAWSASVSSILCIKAVMK
jgi:hypothetical protein